MGLPRKDFVLSQQGYSLFLPGKLGGGGYRGGEASAGSPGASLLHGLAVSWESKMGKVPPHMVCHLVDEEGARLWGTARSPRESRVVTPLQVSDPDKGFLRK